MVDVAKDMLSFWVEKNKVTDELLNAVTKRAQTEPSHLEKLKIVEQESNQADFGEALNEGELANIMQAHKAASPFALDVNNAVRKFKGVS